jgi:hypothetical protein
MLCTHAPRRRPRSPRLTLEILEDRTTPSAVIWTGHGDGTSWGDGPNWSTGQVPGADDDVTINILDANVLHTTDDAVNSLALSAGSLTDSGSLSLQDLSVSGQATLTGPGTETVNGTFTWTGGSLSGAGQTFLEGDSTLSGGSATRLNGRTLTNDGTATFTGGGIDVRGKAVFNNDAGSTAILQGGPSVGSNIVLGLQAAFNNDGLLQKTGAGSAHINIPLNNTDTVDVEQGTLTLTTGASSGDFNVADGALDFSNNLAAGYTLLDGAASTGPAAIHVISSGSLKIAGSVHLDNLAIDGGTVTANAGSDLTADFLTMTGGELTGPGDVSITSSFDCESGTLSGPGATTLNGQSAVSFLALDGRTVTNNGFAAFVGPFFGVEGNGVWNNSDGATTLLSQGVQVIGSATGPGAAFNNAGELDVLGDAGFAVASFEVALNNTGTVDVQKGTLTLSTGASSGTFDVESGATLAFDVNFPAGYTVQDGAAIDGDGLVRVDGAKLNLSGDLSVTNLLVHGVLNVSGSLTADVLTLQGGALNGPGDVTVTSQFKLLGSGLTGPGQLFLEGTSFLSGGSSSWIIDYTINNDGTATLANGGITMLGNSVWNNDEGGTTVLQGGASVLTFTSGPDYAFNNAGLLKTAGGGKATIAIPLTNAATGTVQVQGGSLTLGLLSKTFQTAGTVVVGAGNTFAVNNYTQTDGTTTVDGVLTIIDPFHSGAALSVNGGVLNGAGVINGNVVNAAEVDPGDPLGILTINGNYTQTAAGTLSIEIGGRSAGNQYDRLAVSGMATLDGTLSVTLLNGFQPSPGDTFAVLTFGAHSGTFSEYEGLDVGNGETLSPVFNPNGKEFDLVTTAAS